MRPDVISVGDVMVDVSVEAAVLRQGGDAHGQVRLRPGGAATNAAVWAASAGARARLHGRVGGDLAGELVRQAVEAKGVEAALVSDPTAPTGTMLIVHEPDERSMVADRGANAGLSVDDLPGRLEAGAVLVSGYTLFHPGSEATALAALDRADAEVVAVDAASWPLIEGYGAERFVASTEAANLLLANEDEAGALTGLSDPQEAAGELASRYGTAVVKLGPRGAAVVRGGDLLREEASPVETVDPTGAGDAFDGVLLACLARGSSLESALEEACRAGARCAASPDPWP